MNELALVPRRGFTRRSFLAGAAAALAGAEAVLWSPPLLLLYTVRAITEFGRRVLGGLNPAGAIIAFGGTVAPEGYLLCDGTAVSRTTYARLFNNISTAFGTGDGSTTFNIPDMRFKFPLGKAASGTGSTLGGTGGEENHTLTAAESGLQAHTHTINKNQFNYVLAASGAFFGGVDSANGGSAGIADRITEANATAAGSAHNNMPPWRALNFLIKT